VAELQEGGLSEVRLEESSAGLRPATSDCSHPPRQAHVDCLRSGDSSSLVDIPTGIELGGLERLLDELRACITSQGGSQVRALFGVLEQEETASPQRNCAWAPITKTSNVHVELGRLVSEKSPPQVEEAYCTPLRSVILARV
jgi:hypothetical protein